VARGEIAVILGEGWEQPGGVAGRWAFSAASIAGRGIIRAGRRNLPARVNPALLASEALEADQHQRRLEHGVLACPVRPLGAANTWRPAF